MNKELGTIITHLDHHLLEMDELGNHEVAEGIGLAIDVVEYVASISAVEHGLVYHPKGAADLLVGSDSQGSASCVCGNWQIAVFDNIAGKAATNEGFLRHLVVKGIVAMPTHKDGS